MTTPEQFAALLDEYALAVLTFSIKETKPYLDARYAARTAVLDAFAQARAEPKFKACIGVPDSRCGYLATCEQICNKCGKVHDFNPMQARAGGAVKVPDERTADDYPYSYSNESAFRADEWNACRAEVLRLNHPLTDEPDAWLFRGKGDGEGAAFATVCPPDECTQHYPLERWTRGYTFTPLYTHPPADERVALAEMALGKYIHYPSHWDTAAYPTLADALCEIGCSQCRAHPPAEAATCVIEQCAQICDDLVMYEGEDNPAELCATRIRALSGRKEGS